MSDPEFLLYVIELLGKMEAIAPQQMWLIKDNNFLHQYISQSITLLVEDNDNIIKNKMFAKAFSSTLMEKINNEEDQVVIEKRQVIYALKVFNLKRRFFPCISVKQPLINPTTNNVIGILGQLMEISIINLGQQISEIYRKRPDAIAKIQLSKREKQVIFLFLNNFNSQQIAAAISNLEQKTISRSTIDSLFVDQLYPKFNVYNRPALTLKLKQLGYTTLLPESLLTENSIKLNAVSLY
jgi:hypothetical protein